MTDCGCTNFPASLGNVTFGASVGIGTTSPAAQLDVAGSGATVAAYVGPTSDDVGALVLRGGTANTYWEFVKLRSTDAPADGLYIAFVNGTTPTPVLVATKTGQVGVGTTAPQAPLHVAGGVAPQLRVDSNGQASAFLEFDNGGGSQWQLGSPNAGGGDLVFQKVGTGEFVRITAAGKVGIGTTTPGFTLDVAGTLHYATAISGMAGLIDNDNHAIRSNGAGAQVFANNWGIASQGWIFRDDANGVDRVTIQSAGNVGIGTSSPQALLDVAGQANVGSLTAGGTKLADAAGCYYA